MREQTFKITIEHDYAAPVTIDGVRHQFGDTELVKLKSVTEITEQPEKCVWILHVTKELNPRESWNAGCGFFWRINPRPFTFCPNCGKPIEVRDGK